MVLVWANTIFVEIALRVYTTSIPILPLQWNRTFCPFKKISISESKFIL